MTPSVAPTKSRPRIIARKATQLITKPVGRHIVPFTEIRDAAKLLTVGEAAAAAGWSRRAIYDAVEAGRMPVIEIGQSKTLFIEPVWLADFLNEKVLEAKRNRKASPAPWLVELCQQRARLS